MKTLMKNKVQVLWLAALVMVGCATISPFDQHAYLQTTSLKVEAVHLMGKAVESYDAHRGDVETFQLSLQKLYEYEKNRPKNEITVEMWDKLMNPDGHLLGGFMKRWESEGRLSNVFVGEAQLLVSKAFDQLAGLESKKLKPADIK